MACTNRTAPGNPHLGPRTAIHYSCYFLHILTGRKTDEGANRLATPHGWAAFATVRRKLPTRFHNISIRKCTCPAPDTAEIIARIDNGRLFRTMTLTFRATLAGWRLDHCDLLEPRRGPRSRP